MPVEEFDARLVRSAALTPTVRSFEFERVDGAPLEFRPGQFVQLDFPVGDEMQRRSYSFANIPAKGEPMTIAVAPVEGGLATGYLWSLNEGDTVRLSGPYGRFVLRPKETPDRLILVGTGTGIAPYRAMLPELHERAAAGTRVAILLGVRTREELLYGDAFREAAESSENISFFACYSRADALASDERRGYVHDVLVELGVDPAGDVVYLCGNPNMVDQAVDGLRERGFGPRQIRREKYN